MGMKRNFFLSVFALFFAVFGGVGVAYADYFPECPEIILIGDLDPNATTHTIDYGQSNVNQYDPDWSIVMENNQSLAGTSFCSAEYDSIPTPSVDPGSYCWCGLKTYRNYDDRLSYSSDTPVWVYLDDLGGGCDSDCAMRCVQVMEDLGDVIAFWTDRNAGICQEYTEEECPDPVTTFLDLDQDFLNVPQQDYTVNNPDWDVELEGGKRIHGISACSFVDGNPVPSTLSGQYCYCGFTGYDDGVNASVQPDMTTWFQIQGYSDMGYMQNCLDNCAEECARAVYENIPTYNDIGLCYISNTTYNISYECNSGEGASEASFPLGTVANGGTFTTPASNACSRTGYTFANWTWNANGTGTTMNANTQYTFNFSTDKTLYAQWTQNNYTVSFAAGTNGSGTMSSQTNKHYGDTITLPANEFTPTSGYMFTGWNCNQGIGNKAAGSTFPMPAANVTCTAQWTQITYPFALTTTSLTASDRTFTFDISAVGTFYIDCGSGGALYLEGPNRYIIPSNTITKNSATVETYSCRYSSNGQKTIRFGGLATAYYSTDNTNYAAISFYNAVTNSHTKVASISGSLSQIFPYLGSSVGQFPRFNGTFLNCTHLTSIPNTLFSSLTGGGSSMFNETFRGCTGLTSIPSGLFNFNGSNVSGADYMFSETFANCTGLTGTNAIPSNLFSRVTSSAAGLFESTFAGCSGLTQLPGGLFNFGGNTVAGAHGMFNSTFSGCTSLTSIPSGLFGSFSGGGTSMFLSTFYGCSGLTSLPNGLFTFTQDLVVEQVGGLDRSYMFAETFLGCSGLTSLPSDLFSFGNHIATGNDGMFEATFKNCTNLASIPAGLFSNITSGASSLFSGTFSYCSSLQNIPSTLFNFHNSNSVTGQSGMFNRTFYGCSGITSLPDGLFARITSTANNMFQQTFANCTGLTGYIPTDFFAGLIANNHPYTTDMMEGLFSNTGSLRTTSTGCPSGMQLYTTGYESYWDSHISCQASSYTITYHDTSDCSTALSGLTPTTYTSSAAVSLPTPTRTGYTCNGWNGCTNGNISASTGWAAGTITGNVAVYKNCTGNNIPVYFDSDSSSCNYGSTLTVPQPTRTGYVFMGWKLCSLYGLETGSDGIGYGYVDGNSNSSNTGEYNLTQTNTFATEFDWGTIYGEARCSTTSGTTQGQHGTPSTTAGGYCWCGITSYEGYEDQCTISHPNWVYIDEPGQIDCENVCALNCAEGIQNSSEFREAAFGHI